MDLYEQTPNGLLAITRDPFPLEKDIQKLVEENLEILFQLEMVASEFSVGAFRIDTLAYDTENNSFVIIEYKRGSSYSVIDQGYSYLSAMLNNKAEFILEFNERMDKSLRRDEVDWSLSKVVFISPAFNSYQKNSINFKDVPFELWEIRRFEGGLISLEQHQSSSEQSINSITGTDASSVISQVSAEVKTVTEREVMGAASEKVQDIWQALRERLAALSDCGFYATKKYVGLKKGSKTVCFIHPQKDRIRLDILRGKKSKEGKSSKGFFSLDDPKGIASEHGWTWANGETGHSYRIPVNKQNDLDYLIFLVTQKHESL